MYQRIPKPGSGRPAAQAKSNRFAPRTFTVPAQQPLAVVQRVKAKILEDMKGEVKEAVEFLNYVEPESQFSDFLIGPILNALKIVEESSFAVHCAELIKTIKSKLPEEKPKEEVPVPLESQNIHSIWVHGDYTKEEEVTEGFKSREGSKAEKWQNLIWVYHSLEESNSNDFKKIDGIVCRPATIGNLKVLEADFLETIQGWKERPKWVDDFLPLLEILLSKKSYVTMSDIMRMIVLYYKGGLYQDVKIKLSTPEAKFFDEPLVNTNKLQLVDGGMNKENWALVAEAGCKMIDQIMENTLEKFPPAGVLKQLPENYSNQGKYSKAHKELHENLGPWRQIEKLGSKTERISDVNPSLELENPRPVNSWANDDGVDFNWEKAYEKSKESL